MFPENYFHGKCFWSVLYHLNVNFTKIFFGLSKQGNHSPSSLAEIHATTQIFRRLFSKSLRFFTIMGGFPPGPLQQILCVTVFGPSSQFLGRQFISSIYFISQTTFCLCYKWFWRKCISWCKCIKRKSFSVPGIPNWDPTTPSSIHGCPCRQNSK